MTDKIVVLTTCDSEKRAETLARELVEQRLAACVNIVPKIRSIYRWADESGKDTIEDSVEWLLAIKSRRDLFDVLRAVILKLHTYDLPEIVALQVVDGSEAYLDWLDGQLVAPVIAPAE